MLQKKKQLLFRTCCWRSNRIYHKGNFYFWHAETGFDFTVQNRSNCSGGQTFIAESQRTLREFSSDPIGRRRLDQNPSPFGDKLKVAFHHCGLRIMHVWIWERAFYLAASPRQIEKSFLCALRASAVRFLS